MTLNEYQESAQRTASTKTAEDKLLNGLMGLNGEAGECIDILKKHLFQGHELHRHRLMDEIGDVIWYCAEVATGLGVSLDEIGQRNVAKLRVRYPQGFDSGRSIHRAVKE